jgi:hypothetical protein
MKVRLGDLRKVLETEIDRLVIESRDTRSLIREGLEKYTGCFIDSLEIHQDSHIKNIFAVRINSVNEESDFLVKVVNGNVNQYDGIQETEFTVWPPKN